MRDQRGLSDLDPFKILGTKYQSNYWMTSDYTQIKRIVEPRHYLYDSDTEAHFNKH